MDHGLCRDFQVPESHLLAEFLTRWKASHSSGPMHVGSAELGTSHSQEILQASRELHAQSPKLFPKVNTTEPFISVQASSQQELNTLNCRKIRLLEGNAKCHALKN